jgi:hypothetical protein
VKEEATRLHSRLTRDMKGPTCQALWFEVPGVTCGTYATECAHVIGRVFSHTRTDLDNSFALCSQHHRHFTNWADDWMRFVDQTIGRDEYERLKAKARDGVNEKFDWYEENDRLRAIAESVWAS